MKGAAGEEGLTRDHGRPAHATAIAEPRYPDGGIPGSADHVKWHALTEQLCDAFYLGKTASQHDAIGIDGRLDIAQEFAQHVCPNGQDVFGAQIVVGGPLGDFLRRRSRPWRALANAAIPGPETRVS